MLSLDPGLSGIESERSLPFPLKNFPNFDATFCRPFFCSVPPPPVVSLCSSWDGPASTSSSSFSSSISSTGGAGAVVAASWAGVEEGDSGTSSATGVASFSSSCDSVLIPSFFISLSFFNSSSVLYL